MSNPTTYFLNYGATRATNNVASFNRLSDALSESVNYSRWFILRQRIENKFNASYSQNTLVKAAKRNDWTASEINAIATLTNDTVNNVSINLKKIFQET